VVELARPLAARVERWWFALAVLTLARRSKRWSVAVFAIHYPLSVPRAASSSADKRLLRAPTTGITRLMRLFPIDRFLGNIEDTKDKPCKAYLHTNGSNAQACGDEARNNRIDKISEIHSGPFA